MNALARIGESVEAHAHSLPRVLTRHWALRVPIVARKRVGGALCG